MLLQANKRPYIVINGISSHSIQGLLITSLPSISLPKMRTKAETIDGRDGDIITELGYSSYDKKIEIGLTYDYDVNEIISLFATSGKIVFSNEPDKYYRFSLYDKIDFERLLRFKKAKVNIHVQPFKFSDSEAVKTFTEGPFEIFNQGNYFSRPNIKIRGVGDVDFFINGEKILSIDFGSTEKVITIDSEGMNALDQDGKFYNRYVIGNYDDIRLNAGTNEIALGGDVRSVSFENWSRWL